MVWSPNMGKTNDGMWNSSTHAMSDISALAYRRNVPANELIVPLAQDAGSDQTYEPTRDRMSQSNFADISWNRVGNGRGRGALLQNRDMLHRNDQELRKQLRIANGLGYSNDLIEARFKNSSPSRSQEGEETAVNLETRPFYDDDDLSLSPSHNKDASSDGMNAEEDTSSKKEEVEEEDISIKENGEWNWETRTAKPPPNRVILRNVALQSLKRQKQKASKQAEATAPSDVVSPADPGREEVTPKVKEDWRAENKAAEEARGSRTPEKATACKAKKGWRSGPGEPLLAGLKVDANWSVFAPNESVFAPNETPPPVAEDDHSPTLPKSGPQTKSLLDLGDLDAPRANKSKKKKNKNVRVMYVPPALRSHPEPNVAPEGYLMPTNGVSPMAVRNSQYSPLAGPDIHHTFTNLFGQAVKRFGTNDRMFYQRSDEFSLAKDDFPRLK